MVFYRKNQSILRKKVLHLQRYAFVLYDETGRNILYENLRIGGTSIRIDELASGTIYFFSIAAAGPNEDVGIYSRRTLVRTLGEKQEVNPNEMFIEHMIELPATTVRPSVFTNITVTKWVRVTLKYNWN